MKYFSSVFLMLLFVTFTVEAQINIPAPSPAASLTQVVGLTDVSLSYSRPNMRGRKIFGDLVPYGRIWRTGANATTKLTVDRAISINDKTSIFDSVLVK